MRGGRCRYEHTRTASAEAYAFESRKSNHLCHPCDGGGIQRDANFQRTASSFGPSNPFYAPSSLAFHAPAFDKIKDSDYQPAIDAGMAEQLKEIEAIANNPAPPTFENTFVALEKSGQLFNRA